MVFKKKKTYNNEVMCFRDEDDGRGARISSKDGAVHVLIQLLQTQRVDLKER